MFLTKKNKSAFLLSKLQNIIIIITAVLSICYCVKHFCIKPYLILGSEVFLYVVMVHVPTLVHLLPPVNLHLKLDSPIGKENFIFN